MPPNKKKNNPWNFIIISNDSEYPFCTRCSKNLETLGKIRSHTETIHPDVLQKLEEEPVPKKIKSSDKRNEEIQNDPPEGCSSKVTITNIQRKEKPQREQNNSELVTNIKNKKTRKTRNTEGTKDEKITEAIMNFIIMDHQPFSVGEGNGFIQLMREVIPHYNIPSRETFEKRVDEKYESMSKVFKDSLKAAEHYCLSYDTWTETMPKKSFLGVTIHFLEKPKLKSGTLGFFELLEITQRNSRAEYIQRRLQQILDEWCISLEKVTAVVTDTDNENTVMEVNRNMFGEEKMIPCFGHTLNLVVNNSLDKAKKASMIISEVCNSFEGIQVRKELWKQQREEGQTKKLTLDVYTRWNSTYYMLERFMELSLPNNAALSRIKPIEMTRLREIVQLLQPFERLTQEILRENYVTISNVIPFVSCLRNMLEKCSPKFDETITLKAEIEKEVSERLDKLEQCSFLAIATTLDPRFKSIHFKDATAKDKVISSIRNYITSMQATGLPIESSDKSEKEENTERGSDFWSHHKQITCNNIKKKTDTTKCWNFESPPELDLEEDPIEKWDDLKTSFPDHYKLAIKYLPIVATSVPGERLFSEAGDFIPQERNRLQGIRLSKLLFLSSIMKNK